MSFWRDKWCEGTPLCDFFPSLFALAVSKEAWVKDVWNVSEGGGSCSPRFTRSFNDWEVDEVENLLLWLGGKIVNMDEEDRVLRMPMKSGKFSVKSLYKALELESSVYFPIKIIWNSCVQPKVSFFAWEASWGKTLTLDQIQKRGWALANGCYLCHSNEESIDLLLFHCVKTRALWEMFFSLFGVSWVFPSLVKETLLSWNESFVGKKCKKVWRVDPLCIFLDSLEGKKQNCL